MSEEEIIRNVKRIIEYKVISNYINNNDSNAIQGLLDLYQKEKEKNWKYQVYCLPNDVGVKNGDKIITFDTSNYINKDKIREKIKEFEDSYMISSISDSEEKEYYKLVIIVLQELLEE